MDEIKVGIIGLDTSHCPAFTRILNDAQHEYHVPGAHVVGAFPGGSELFSRSRDRVQGFTRQLREEYGVRMYDDIPALVQDVDAILIESVDGRQHLDQLRELAGQAAEGPKPVFVDKPLATSTADARQIIQIASGAGIPLMSSSSLRYAAGIADLAEEGERVMSCEAFGPAPILEDYPGLFWYGIHSAEILMSYMGRGCETVRCIPSRDVDVIVAEWGDGRVGVVRGTRFVGGSFGCVVHTAGASACGIAQDEPPYYYSLIKKVVEFFESGVSPVDVHETFEIISMLEAANWSREHLGQIARLERP